MPRQKLVEPTEADKSRPDYPYYESEVAWEFRGIEIWCREGKSEDTADRLRAVNILSHQFNSRMECVNALKSATEENPISYQNGSAFFWTEKF